MTYARVVDAKMDNLNLRMRDEVRGAREVCERVARRIVAKQSVSKLYGNMNTHIRGGR